MKYLVYKGTIYHSEFALVSGTEGTTVGAMLLTKVFKKHGILVGNDPQIDAQRLADATGEEVTVVRLYKL